MQKFIILTRGRTGSSAVAEELGNHPQIVCDGEIARPGVKPDGRYVKMPLRAHANAFGRKVTSDEFSRWFEYLVQSAGEAKAVGFKMLDNHLADIDGGINILRDIKIIHLQRRNLVRQAVSFILAKERGSYNSKQIQTAQDPIEIKPSAINSRVRRAMRLNSERAAAINELGIDTIDAYYEEWLESRTEFYRPIFKLLGVEELDLTPTTWQAMAPQPLDQLIVNYPEVARKVTKAGFGDMIR